MVIIVFFPYNRCSKLLQGREKMPRSDKRPHKGESLLQFADNYTLVDIETTGLDPEYDSIIEIGAVKVSDNKIVDEYSTLVNPLCGIDSFIESLTGITNEMLDTAPVIEDILSDFRDFVKDDIIIGHNINFDINFLYDIFPQILKEDLTNDFICTMRLSRRTFKELKSHKMSVLIDYLKLPDRNHHRAMQDCYSTKDLYDYIRSFIKEKEIDITELFSRPKYDFTKIKSQVDEMDENHLLYNKNIVFTGVLEKMVRKEAAQLAANHGAICQNGVNKHTNILVLGNNDYNPSIKDGISSKQKKAQEYILKGQDLIIISENVFYDMVLDE